MEVEQIDWDFPVTVAQCVLMSRVRGRIAPWASRSEKADVARVRFSLARVLWSSPGERDRGTRRARAPQVRPL